jgi:hypothetical protein
VHRPTEPRISFLSDLFLNHPAQSEIDKDVLIVKGTVSDVIRLDVEMNDVQLMQQEEIV